MDESEFGSMKVLFISHALEATGVGEAARNYILAMDSVGIDVVPRYIRLGSHAATLPQRILDLEKQSSEDCDVCIQFLLPHQMRYDGEFDKCIALYDYECGNFATSGWPYILNMFDEVWTPNNQFVGKGEISGIKVPQYTVPHAIDPTKYNVPFKKVVDGHFFFYFVGEANERKNIGALIKAFHREFGIHESTSLVIKTSKHGMSPEQVRDGLTNLINKIKGMLKLYPTIEHYKKDVIISEYLSEEQMVNLHKSCHCFVMPSHGEAMCLPALDALAVGNPVLCSDVGGLRDIINEDNGILISGQQAPVEGMMDTFPELSTGFETWFDINVPELSRQMRYAYDNYKALDKEKIKSSVVKFHHQQIGNRILEVLKGNAKSNY